jgi:hypothetical protein
VISRTGVVDIIEHVSDFPVHVEDPPPLWQVTDTASRHLDCSDHPPAAPLTGQTALDGMSSPGKVDALVAVMTRFPPD